MQGLILSKVARNIDQGDRFLGLQSLDLLPVFLAFQFGEMLSGIGSGLSFGLSAYGLLLYIRSRQADGFLLHAGWWLAGPSVYFAFVGLDEKGETHG